MFKHFIPLIFAGSVSACGPSVEIESPPDVAELEAGFAAPTGVATVQAVTNVMSRVRANPTFLWQNSLTALPEQVSQFEALRQTEERERPPLALGDLALNAVGSGRFENPCTPAEGFDSGLFAMSFAFTQDGLDRTIWGDIQGCEHVASLQGESVALGLVGSFTLILVDQEGFEPNLDTVILRFNGKFFEQGVEVFDGQLEAKIENDEITHRFPLDDGTYFFHSFTRDLKHHSFQDLTGTYTCDLELELCESSDGTTFAL